MESNLRFFLFLMFFIFAQYKLAVGTKFGVSKTYYIRHFEGKCLEYDEVRQVLVYGKLCREKFKWQGGARLIHIPTKKCVTVNATSDGSFLSLSSQCSETNTLFQYDENNRVIRHLFANKCLHPETGDADPAINTAIVLKVGCEENINKFYFRKKAYYIIRHFGGLCWVYYSGENLIKLMNPFACDRFEYVNNYHLRHVETGKCVIFSSSYMRLTDDCESPETYYKLNQFSLLQNGSTSCIHPAGGALYPPNGNFLLLKRNGCFNEDRLRFSLFDDKDLLKAKIMSESCKDIPPYTGCAFCKSHVLVNGHQHSLNLRGIDIVLFDYRSGLFEHRMNYDVIDSTVHQDNLATFLNNLPSGKILFMSAKDAVNMSSNLALALQKVGVSATFATSPVPSVYMSLAYVGYTGQVRKDWEKSVNKIGGSGASIIEFSIKTFHERDGIDDCSNELGVRTRKIPDSRFYAKTVWSNDNDHKPYTARLHLSKPGWCSGSNEPVSEYLQVDLGTRKILSGVAIQAHGSNRNHGISKFTIEFSIDGINWGFYKRGLSSAVELDGLQGEHNDKFETKVNWIQNIQMRFIRVVPTARVGELTTCLRIELFGCSISRSFVSVELSPSSSIFVNDRFTGTMSLFGTMKKNISVHMSTAPDVSSLSTSNDQFHFRGMNASTTVDNGTVSMENSEVNLLTDWARKVDNEAFIQFGLKEDNYYAFEVDFVGKVVDATHPTGNTFLTITTESETGILAYSTPYQIKRSKKDRSNLQFNLTTFNLDNLVENSYPNISLSISHMVGQSNSNAYRASIMIYFNTNFIQLNSLTFVNTSRFSLPPSRNTTKPGFIMIQTDTLWLLNRQEFSIILQAKYPKGISRGETCNGNIIIDFSYKNNLAKFSGTTNSTLEKMVHFKCKIDQSNDIQVKSLRLPSPAFSMVYDEENQQFFFCYQKKTHATKDSATCFFTEKQIVFWRQLPYISSLTGVDVEKKILYGLSRFGKSYAISYYPYRVFDQVDDSEWTQAKDRQQIRKALKAASVDLLPESPESSWIINESGQAIWAATKRGISKRVDGVWKRKVAFDKFK